MHLVINTTEIGRQRGGNESYLQGLLEGLDELEKIPSITLLLTPIGMEQLSGTLSGRFSLVSVGNYQRLAFYLWQQTLWLRRQHSDWYLSTFFLPPITPGRAAVLVHDLSFHAHPEYFPATIAWYMRFLTRLALHRADRIIALSEFTRQEIGRFHPIALEKTSVVHPGVAHSFTTEHVAGENEILQRYGLSTGFILVMGNIHPRKNLSRLLDAYLLLRMNHPMPIMVWVGQKRWESGELVERARSAGVVLTGFVPQTDLPVLYRNACMLVYPSLYEGFGLPPLEAMACGTPVVTSNTSSLPEAVCDAALLVDPTSIKALADAIRTVLNDRSVQETLRREGLRRALGFSWKRTAEELLASLD